MRYADPVPTTRRDAGSALWMGILGVLVVFLLIVAGWLLITLKTSAMVMAIPALVPLAIVLFAAWWLDRWEPEPRALLALGLLYGAGAAVLGTLWGGNLTLRMASQWLDPSQLDVFTVAFQGPFVEEVIKGLGLLLILAIARREFDGPIDGFIYAAMIGAGFAFTENIIYFANAGAGSLVWTLVVRGILSPFAHALFTGITGMILGAAARRGGAARIGLSWLVGVTLAVLAHAFWNSGSVLLLPLLGLDPANPVAWIGYYLAIDVPLFLLLCWALFRLRSHDQAMTRARLEEYAEKGWFTANEVTMITDWDARTRALKWAKEGGPRRHRAMRDFIEDATRLAYAREHASVDKRDPDRRIVERALLLRVQADRQAIAEAKEPASAAAQVSERTAG